MSAAWPPDWRDSERYADRSTTSSAEWAWEFLRRRPDYQRDYQELVKPVVAEDGSIGNGRLICLFEERYGLSFPLPPSRPAGPEAGLLFLDNYVAELRSWASNEPQSVTVKPGTVFIKFDLGQPIPGQLQRTAQILRDEQSNYLEKSGRSLLKLRGRSQKWPLYLRLLDAEAAGATITDIANCLFPEVQNEYPDYAASDAVRKSLRAAKRLQSQYRAIAGLDTPGK